VFLELYALLILGPTTTGVIIFKHFGSLGELSELDQEMGLGYE